jgi:hypothetical protein
LPTDEAARVAAAYDGSGPQLASNHSPQFAPVPKPTIETSVEAMTQGSAVSPENVSLCPGVPAG